VQGLFTIAKVMGRLCIIVTHVCIAIVADRRIFEYPTTAFEGYAITVY